MIGATGPGDCGTGIGEWPDEAAIDALLLRPPAPNPFAGSTTISCVLPRAAGELTVGIYSAAGKCVRTLTGGGSGKTRMMTWDGRDDRGEPVASGVYFVRATSGERSASGKVLLVK
jgi:flagellar hook assembly protein FlgD